MDQAQMVAKLAPAIGLRRQLDPRNDPEFATYADPVLKSARCMQPSEHSPTRRLTPSWSNTRPRRSRPTLRPDRILQQRPRADLVSRVDPAHHPPVGGGHQRPDRPADRLRADLRRHRGADRSRYRHGQERERLE